MQVETVRLWTTTMSIQGKMRIATTRGQNRGRLLIFSAQCINLLGIRFLLKMKYIYMYIRIYKYLHMCMIPDAWPGHSKKPNT